MTIAIYPYMNGSKSAKALAEGLGIKVLKREGKARRVTTLINWGCSNIERDIRFNNILNEPAAIRNASNKLNTFRLFEAEKVPTVPWTTVRETAQGWADHDEKVVVRHKLSGHSGEGIEIITDAVPNAPLYTKYVKKTQEYRIHVFQDQVVFEQRKARKKDVPDDQVNWQVRNLAGGFIFANADVAVPAEVRNAAIAAIKALGLDFGAADIGIGKEGVVVYEVNTACGIQGKNLENYVNIFKQFK